MRDVPTTAKNVTGLVEEYEVPVESVKRALSPLLGAGKGDVDVTE